MQPRAAFPNLLCMGGTPNLIIPSRWIPYNENVVSWEKYNDHRHRLNTCIPLYTNWPKQNKEAFCSARRLHHYCQLPDKHFWEISKDIWGFSQYYNFSIYFWKIYRGNPNDILQNSRLSLNSLWEILG